MGAKYESPKPAAVTAAHIKKYLPMGIDLKANYAIKKKTRNGMPAHRI